MKAAANSGILCRLQPSPAAARAALALLGFSAIVGQIVLMRELIVVFNGNEMSLGIILATWLFWSAIGSWPSSTCCLGRNHTRRTVATLECLLAASLPMTIWALRAAKPLFQTVPGELVGPLPMLFGSVACLSLFCATAGGLFVVAARLYLAESCTAARVTVSTAYLLEAAGSAVGGLVASVVLLRFLVSFQIAAVVVLLNLCMAAVLSWRMNFRQVVVLVGSVALIAIPVLLLGAPWLERLSRISLWRGFHLVESRDTIYGNLTVTETGAVRTIYDNGVVLANAPDDYAAEEAVHYALLEHTAPHTVLLIGGGVNGSIAQALKHPTIERIDYIELDPALIQIARQSLTPESSGLEANPRVHLHCADGVRFLKTAAGVFDVIIVDVPDPTTAQLNRFYTAEFFRTARERLAPGGLVAIQLHSSEEAVSPDLAEFLRCIKHTLDTVFPYVVIIPGETIHFFGAMQPNVLTVDPATLIQRLRSRHLNTQYVREYFIPYRMAPDRIEQIGKQLQPLASTPVNRDFAPIAYYFNVVLWCTQFSPRNSGWFRTAAHVPFRCILSSTVVLLLLIAALAALAFDRERRARSAAAFCIATAGFTSMVLQILLLLAFQSIYGYVYHQLAILIGLCMAGIACGSWLGIGSIRRLNRRPHPNLASTQFLLALSTPALMYAVSFLAKISGSATTWIAAQLIFPVLAALAGLLGGYQFPVAAEIYLHDRGSWSRLGTLYSIDLLGGCTGALVLSTFLIPVFGFWETAWLSAAINLAPALLAMQVNLEARKVRA
ncbi:MAG: fused MFS/spermidine synthase [Terracidiphilus sp.]